MDHTKLSEFELNTVERLMLDGFKNGELTVEIRLDILKRILSFYSIGVAAAEREEVRQRNQAERDRQREYQRRQDWGEGRL